MNTAPRLASGRPLPGEYADYAQADIERVAGDDAVAALVQLTEGTLALLAPLADDAVAGVAYAPGKWTLKQVVGHLVDDERIFAYRALAVARGESAELPGFDETIYAAAAGHEARRMASLCAEYRAVRGATLALFAGLPAEAWTRRGRVNGYSATVRGLAFHIAGHELRHVAALREKYLPLVR